MTDSTTRSVVDEMEAARIAELVEEFLEDEETPAQVHLLAAEWDRDGESGIGDTYRAVAEELERQQAAARLVATEVRYPVPHSGWVIGDTATGVSAFSGRPFAHRFEGMTADGLAEFSGIQL